MRKLFQRKSAPPIVESEELARLRQIKQLVVKLVRILDDGEVDYDLVEQLKALLNG